MLCGESRHTVDAKNRVFVPKKFQQELPLGDEGQRVGVLTRGMDGCLYLFPDTSMKRALAGFSTQAYAPAQYRKLQRLLYSVTNVVSLDASGRLLIPEKLREMAKIKREVCLIGVENRIEIWAAELWDAFENENGDEAFEELEALLTGEADFEAEPKDDGDEA